MVQFKFCSFSVFLQYLFRCQLKHMSRVFNACAVQNLELRLSFNFFLFFINLIVVGAFRYNALFYLENLLQNFQFQIFLVMVKKLNGHKNALVVPYRNLSSVIYSLEFKLMMSKCLNFFLFVLFLAE